MATYKLNSYGVVEYPPNDAEDNPFINSTEVAEHFQVKEFTCTKPGDTTWIHPQLAYALEKLRTEFFRRAITIYSGHRTVAYNDNLAKDGNGTAWNSEHIYGTAADIHPSRREGWTDESQQWVEDAIAIYRNRSAYGLRGVGLYDYAGSDADDSYIHVDVGPGSSAPSLKEGMKREERPSFWYQWIRNPVQGQAYAIYLYESDKISKLLNNLQASGGDPRHYISGLTGGKTRVVVHGEEESSGGDSSYSDTFTEYRGRTKLLQLYLRFRGMYSGSVDGIYGSGTAAGVREFQEENDLDNDGVIVWDGGNTFPMMFPTLRRGQRDSDSSALTRNRNIAFLQTILAEELGYSYVGEADGIFGSNTEKAVEDIQGSGADGIVGPLTWDQIATLLE